MVSMVWTSAVVDNSLAAASDTALVLVADQPHIFFYDAANNLLKYAVRSQGSWTTETIAAGGSAESEVAAVLCDAELCVSYYDAAAQDLRCPTSPNL